MPVIAQKIGPIPTTEVMLGKRGVLKEILRIFSLKYEFISKYDYKNGFGILFKGETTDEKWQFKMIPKDDGRILFDGGVDTINYGSLKQIEEDMLKQEPFMGWKLKAV